MYYIVFNKKKKIKLLIYNENKNFLLGSLKNKKKSSHLTKQIRNFKYLS